jgi:hypothetical protein
MMSAPAIQPAYRAEDEKRKYPRFRVNLEIELNIDGQAAPLRTHTSDVGLGGCYVEMLFTLPVGSRLDLTLWLGREKWRSRAEVVTRDPQFGNGIRFLNLEDDKRVRLGQFLDTLPPQQVTDNF